MGAAACLVKQAGFDVAGTDVEFAPPMSHYLESTQIRIESYAHLNSQLLKQYDLIVVGNVVPKNSKDARMIEQSGVSFCSFPAVLGALILDNKKVIGVAGTHGKTTTAFFMTQLFEKLGEKPGHFIGGVLPGRASSSLGSSKYFIIESDEYDSAYFEKISKFRLYGIKRLVLTSLEFDHADIFEDVEAIKREFHFILPEIAEAMVYDETYTHAADLLGQYSQLKTIPYGEKQIKILKESPEGTIFELWIEKAYQRFETNIIGKHNIFNLSACLLTARAEGFPVQKLQDAVQNLEMTKRRQEKRGYFFNTPVYDDFAHHPRSVECTIEALKVRYPNKKIYVVLEPNSATARSDLFQESFAKALEKADLVILAKPLRSTTVKGAGELDCHLIVDHLNQKKISALVVENLETLIEKIEFYNSIENIWLILSNGTCLGLWKSSFVEKLTERYSESN